MYCTSTAEYGYGVFWCHVIGYMRLCPSGERSIVNTSNIYRSTGHTDGRTDGEQSVVLPTTWRTPIITTSCRPTCVTLIITALVLGNGRMIVLRLAQLPWPLGALASTDLLAVDDQSKYLNRQKTARTDRVIGLIHSQQYVTIGDRNQQLARDSGSTKRNSWLITDLMKTSLDRSVTSQWPVGDEFLEFTANWHVRMCMIITWQHHVTWNKTNNNAVD